MMRTGGAGARRPLVIFGAGSFARLLVSLCRSNGFQPVALTVDDQYLPVGESAAPLPIVEFSSAPRLYPPESHDILIAIGYRSIRARKQAFSRIQAAGYRCSNLICKESVLSRDSVLGEGNIVFPGAIVEPFVRIGNNNVLWSGSIICHDSFLGAHSYLAPRVTVSGNCAIGDMCFFGTSVTIIDGVSVADETYVRAGSVLFQPTDPLGKYAGNPAVRIGEVDPSIGLRVGRGGEGAG